MVAYQCLTSPRIQVHCALLVVDQKNVNHIEIWNKQHGVQTLLPIAVLKAARQNLQYSGHSDSLATKGGSNSVISQSLLLYSVVSLSDDCDLMVPAKSTPCPHHLPNTWTHIDWLVSHPILMPLLTFSALGNHGGVIGSLWRLSTGAWNTKCSINAVVS